MWKGVWKGIHLPNQAEKANDRVSALSEYNQIKVSTFRIMSYGVPFGKAKGTPLICLLIHTHPNR